MKKDESLKKLEVEIFSCRKCSPFENAVKAVPGEGNPEAKIVFIGEAPGFYEDKEGRPFVGRAGMLLDSLPQSIKVGRSDVWIGNLVKHRPPGNRDPKPAEIKACSAWLDKQIEIISPRIIVTLERLSMNKFFPQEKITRIHGVARTVYWNNKKIVVVPMYHPAAGLRSIEILRTLKEDFLRLGKIINF